MTALSLRLSPPPSPVIYEQSYSLLQESMNNLILFPSNSTSNPIAFPCEEFEISFYVLYFSGNWELLKYLKIMKNYT